MPLSFSKITLLSVRKDIGNDVFRATARNKNALKANSNSSSTSFSANTSSKSSLKERVTVEGLILQYFRPGTPQTASSISTVLVGISKIVKTTPSIHINALGKVEKLMFKFIQRTVALSHTLKPAEICEILVNFAEIKSFVGFSSILCVVEARIDEFSYTELIECLWAYASFNIHNLHQKHVFFLRTRVLRKLSFHQNNIQTLSPLSVFHFIYGLAKLELFFESRTVILSQAEEYVLKILRSKNPEISASQLVYICWSFKMMQYHPIFLLFSESAKFLKAYVDELEWEELLVVKNLFQSAEFRSNKIVAQLLQMISVREDLEN